MPNIRQENLWHQSDAKNFQTFDSLILTLNKYIFNFIFILFWFMIPVNGIHCRWKKIYIWIYICLFRDGMGEEGIEQGFVCVICLIWNISSELVWNPKLWITKNKERICRKLSGAIRSIMAYRNRTIIEILSLFFEVTKTKQSNHLFKKIVKRKRFARNSLRCGFNGNFRALLWNAFTSFDVQANYIMFLFKLRKGKCE